MKEPDIEQDIRKHKILEAYLNRIKFKDIGSGKLLAGCLESNSFHVFDYSFYGSIKNIIKIAGYLIGMFKYKYIQSHNSEYIFTKINNKFHFGTLIDPLIFYYLEDSAIFCNENSLDKKLKATISIKKHLISANRANDNSWQDIGIIVLTTLKVLSTLIRINKRLKLSFYEIIIFLKLLILQLRSVSFWDRYFENSSVLPKCIVTELDRTSMPSPLILSAKKYKILTITLTHGTISEYGFAPLFADYIFCWGKFQKLQLISQGIEPCRISITGNPMFKTFNLLPKKNINNVSGPIIVCLAISPEGDELNRLLIGLFIKAIKGLGKVKGIIKLHPNLNRESFLWVQSLFPDINILESSDIKNSDLFQTIDLLLIRYSGIANEALASGVPVIIVNPENISELNILQEALIHNAGCELARNDQELIAILNKICASPFKYQEDAKTKCKNYLSNLYELTGEDSEKAMIAEIDKLTGGI